MLFDEDFLRKLEGLRFAVRRAVQGRREGERHGRRKGGTSDFRTHRSYVQGDEFRAIDWNLYGRLGQLYVKEFTREEALEVRVLVDPTPSMAPKFEYARRLGAALALVASEEATPVPLAELEAMKPAPRFAIPDVPRGLAIVVSDLWDEGLRRDLVRLRGETAVIHLLSPEELEPTLSGKLRLVDAETGESLVRFVGPEERARYRELLAEHCEGWKRWCFERELNYLRCSTAAPLEEVVRLYLREAGVIE